MHTQDLNMSEAEVIRLFNTLPFRAFDQTDWYAFAGAESDEPLIAHTDELSFIIDEIDGHPFMNIISSGDQFQQVALVSEVPDRMKRKAIEDYSGAIASAGMWGGIRADIVLADVIAEIYGVPANVVIKDIIEARVEFRAEMKRSAEG